MVVINHATKEITVKLVYYGPGLCGKTTNLEHIYSKLTPEKRGRMISVATETDRTLFFDFLPVDLGSIGGMNVRTQLYTVPGQVFYDATRRLVLRGADGVIFVADSQKAMLESNKESLENLKQNLRINGLDPERIPIILQFNKRDLGNLSTPEELNEELNWRKLKTQEAVATVGEGVKETLQALVGQVIRNVKDGVDISLRGEELPRDATVVEEVPAEQAPPIAKTEPEPMEEPAATAEPDVVPEPALEAVDGVQSLDDLDSVGEPGSSPGG